MDGFNADSKWQKRDLVKWKSVNKKICTLKDRVPKEWKV